DLFAAAVVLPSALAILPLVSAVRQACAEPGILPVPTPFRHATFSWPCVLATAAPALLTPFRQPCWLVDCWAGADATVDTSRPTTAAVDTNAVVIDIGQ